MTKARGDIMRLLKSNKGFSMIELVVAMLITSLVAGVIITILTSSFRTFKTVSDSVEKQELANNILVTVRNEIMDGAEIELLSFSTDYTSEFTYDNLFTTIDGDGNIIDKDFKGKATMSYGCIVCGPDGGITLYDIVGTQSTGAVSISSSDLYTIEQVGGELRPVIMFARDGTSSPNTLDVHVKLYDDVDATDDGTMKFADFTGLQAELSSTMSFHNSEMITQPMSGSDLFYRAVLYKKFDY